MSSPTRLRKWTARSSWPRRVTTGLIASRAAASSDWKCRLRRNKEVSLDLLLDAQRRLMDSEMPLLSGAGRIRGGGEERALRQGNAARLRRRVPGGRAMAGRSVQDAADLESMRKGRRGRLITPRRGRRAWVGAKCRKTHRERARAKLRAASPFEGQPPNRKVSLTNRQAHWCPPPSATGQLQLGHASSYRIRTQPTISAKSSPTG